MTHALTNTFMLVLVSNFHPKHFEGFVFEFSHLAPTQERVPLDEGATRFIALHVAFGSHCFTETFDKNRHRDHHRYVYNGEVRAFCPTRYECSLHLPSVVKAMLSGRVYNADESYTFVAQITIPSRDGLQPYSVFFSLRKDSSLQAPALKMFVKSAYIKPLVAKTNKESWRFKSLAGQISGAFPKKVKKPKPQKNRAP